MTQGSRSLEIATVMLNTGGLLFHSGVWPWIPVTTFNFALPHHIAPKFPNVTSKSRLVDYLHGEKLWERYFNSNTSWSCIYHTPKNLRFDLKTPPWQDYCKLWLTLWSFPIHSDSGLFPSIVLACFEKRPKYLLYYIILMCAQGFSAKR